MTKPNLFVVPASDEMIAEANGFIDMCKMRGMDDEAINKASFHPVLPKGIGQVVRDIIKG